MPSNRPIKKTEIEAIVNALNAARHALTISDGASATVRPHLVHIEGSKNVFWKIDHSTEVKQIDAALDILSERG